MLRYSARRCMLEQFATVLELRQIVNALRRSNTQGATFKAAVAELQLVVALTESREPEDRREALIRGDPLWTELQSPGLDTPQMSKVVLLTTLTDSMNVCASSLRDIDAVALWKERSWKYSSPSESASATPPRQQSSPTATSSNSDAATGKRRGTSTEPVGRDGDSVASRLFGAVARLFGAGSSSQRSATPIPDADGQVGRADKSLEDPHERTKLQVLKMIQEANPTLGAPTNASASGSTVEGSGRAMAAGGGNRRRTGMNDLRHKLNGEQHPMVETIFRKKPDKGPRYT